MDRYDANRMIGSDIASALDMMEIDCDSKTIDEVLPEAMLIEVLSRLPDARDLARCAVVNQFFRSSFKQVKSARFICRRMFPAQGVTMPFKETVARTLVQLERVENLRLEIEEKMQAKRFKEDELDKNSLWLSEKPFVSTWLPPVSHSLQNLCLIDYGQQAIFRRSPLLQALSVCPNLQTLELRNMYLDCTGCQTMKKVKSLTLRCVKLTADGLRDIGNCMLNLEILTLVTVVGLKDAELKSDKLKELCLGLATKVNSVKLDVSSLIKLQLKMACPDKLKVIAPNLKHLALCMGQNRSLEFEGVSQLRELLMGASEFFTLSRLSAANASLEKVFLDIPCMAFDESGVWKAVLKQVPLNVPEMECVRASCPKLHTMSVGPGLWHSFEQGMNTREANGDIILPKWPALRRLILHVIVIDTDTSVGLLKALVRAIPTLTVLELYVHESSKVRAQEFCRLVKPFFPPLELKVDSWKKGLKFGCFSF